MPHNLIHSFIDPGLRGTVGPGGTIPVLDADEMGSTFSLYRPYSDWAQSAVRSVGQFAKPHLKRELGYFQTTGRRIAGLGTPEGTAEWREDFKTLRERGIDKSLALLRVARDLKKTWWGLPGLGKVGAPGPGLALQLIMGIPSSEAQVRVGGELVPLRSRRAQLHLLGETPSDASLRASKAAAVRRRTSDSLRELGNVLRSRARLGPFGL